MTRELAAIVALTIMTGIFWVGWFAFEIFSAPNRPSFEGKDIQPLNPKLVGTQEL